MDLSNYTPIDYRNWDFSGRGKNILHLLEDDEKELWNLALPYQDSRPDETGHGEYVVYSALKLIPFVGGISKIIVGSATTHDIGWSQLHKVERELFCTPGIWERYEPILRARHQEEGEKLSRELLSKIPSFSNYIESICQIVSQHDTRKGFLSLEDGVMRSADVSWRFSLVGIKLGIEQRGWSEEELKRRWKEWREKLLYNDTIKNIVDIEAENALKAYKEGLANF